MDDKVRSRDSYAAVRDHLTKAIADGAFNPSGRLPTERELAEQFVVSRGTARRALSDLEKEGVILRLVGRGTFVRSIFETAPSPSIQGIPYEKTSPSDFLEARLRFEPEMASLAVNNATEEDFEQMEHCLKKGDLATSLYAFEDADAAFHSAMAKATHNSLMIAMYGLIDAARQHKTMWGKLKASIWTDAQHKNYQREHRAIFEALRQRDAEASRQLLATHIRNTRSRLLGE